MYQKIIQFIKYHNAFTIGLALAFVFSGAIFASDAAREATIGKAVVEQQGIDNSAILAADVDNFDFGMTIIGVSEDTQNYYVDYVYQSLAIRDNVWQTLSRQATLTVSKSALTDRDLGLYVAEELGEIVDCERAYLKEVQELEDKKGQTQIVQTTTYTGLIGLTLDLKNKILPGYEPVVKPPVAEIVQEPIVQEPVCQPITEICDDRMDNDCDGKIDAEDENCSSPDVEQTPTNNAPVANDQNLTTEGNTPINITLTASDADGDSLTYIIVSQPANGVLSGEAPNLTCTPNPDYSGQDAFTFKVNDGTADSDVATITIIINPTCEMQTFFRDSDGDNYGDPNNSTSTCEAPEDYISDNTDCDDSNPKINPGATEICDNGTDNDCDEKTDADDEDCQTAQPKDTDGDGLIDSEDACPEKAGDFCHGCPPPECSGCQSPFCPETGQPICQDNDLLCQAENATGICQSGACNFTCQDGFSDCNTDMSDGCEFQLETPTSTCPTD